MNTGMMGEDKRKMNVGAFFIGIAVGAVIGGGAALLFAPKSGRETRSLIRDKAVETGHMVKERASDIKGKASQIGRTIRSKAEREMESVE
jgi:gas vesicle protein